VRRAQAYERLPRLDPAGGAAYLRQTHPLTRPLRPRREAFDDETMRTLLLIIPALLLAASLASCAGDFRADPRAASEQRLYNSEMADVTDAVQRVMARLQWHIEHVEETPGGYHVTGRYMNRAASGGTQTYGLDIRIENAANELVRVTLNVQDGGGGYGSTRPSDIRRLFFDGLARERISPVS
jgi:hypothetical protein